MINIANRIKVNGSVLAVQQTGRFVVVVDNLYNLYLLDKEKLQFVKTLNITKNHTPWHRYGRGMAISKDDFLNVALTKSPKSIVLQIVDGVKKLTILNWHKADISVSRFSPDGKMLSTGGEDGKTILYSLPSFDMAMSLFPRPDYISNIMFSDDSHLIASSCFDSSVHVFDIERSSDIAEFMAPDVVEDGAFFDEKRKLFFICKDGSTGVFDFESNEIVTQSNHFNEWLTACCVTKSRQFAIVSGKGEHLYVVRLRDNARIMTIKMEHVGATHLEFITPEKLFVCYIDGVVEIIDFERYADEMEVHLKVNDYAKAKGVIEKNEFLRLYPTYNDKLDEAWKAVLKQAIDLLAKNQPQGAMKLVEIFIEDPARNEEFTYYMAQRENIARFLEAMEVNDILEAYNIAENDPDVRKLSAYDKLEEYWLKVFATAKKLLQSNPGLNKGKAEEILKPFAQVRSKKSLVTTLLNNSEKYTEADHYLKERNFSAYFNLAEKFSFLKETEVYKKTLTIGEQFLEKMSQLENAKNFQKALEVGKILTTLIPFRKMAMERSKLIEKKMAFLEAYEKKDVQLAYHLIEGAPDLKSLPEFIALNERFKELSEEAYKKAFSGFSKEALDQLSDYLEVAYWEDKIASIMNVAYLNEIRNCSEAIKEATDWGKTLSYYIDRFGKNDELEKVCGMKGLKEHLGNIDSKGDPSGYRHCSYLTTILARKEG